LNLGAKSAATIGFLPREEKLKKLPTPSNLFGFPADISVLGISAPSV